MGQAELTEAAAWPKQVRASGTHAIAPGHGDAVVRRDDTGAAPAERCWRTLRCYYAYCYRYREAMRDATEGAERAQARPDTLGRVAPARLGGAAR